MLVLGRYIRSAVQHKTTVAVVFNVSACSTLEYHDRIIPTREPSLHNPSMIPPPPHRSPSSRLRLSIFLLPSIFLGLFAKKAYVSTPPAAGTRDSGSTAYGTAKASLLHPIERGGSRSHRRGCGTSTIFCRSSSRRPLREAHPFEADLRALAFHRIYTSKKAY